MDPEHYKNKDVVEKYDEVRFKKKSWRKKYFDIFERGCVTKWLKPGTVLDVGCGTSRFGFLSNYTGIDFSEPMIKKARRKYPNNKYKVADAKDLPFEDNSFDNVFSIRVIMHVKNWKEVIEEMHRVCKPGGRVIFDIKPTGIMSLLLRWRDKTLDKEKLRLNIISMKELNEYNIIHTADYPPVLPMTRFIVIEKE